MQGNIETTRFDSILTARHGAGSTNAPQRGSSALLDWEMGRTSARGDVGSATMGGRGGMAGEVRGVASGMDGGLRRHPPSGMSNFSLTTATEPCSSPRSSSEVTPPPPPLNHGSGSTATVLARYWPPPDGQPGIQITRNEGMCSHMPAAPCVW